VPKRIRERPKYMQHALDGVAFQYEVLE